MKCCAVIGLAVLFAVAAGDLAGCGKGGSTASNLVKKKKQMGEAGDDVMSRLGSPATRAKAARELGETKNKAAAPALKGYIEDKDPNVRLNCVWALGEIGDAGNVVEVRNLLTDHERAVRAEAARALAKMPSIDAVLWLGQAIAKDTDPDVRVEAARALGKVKDANAAEWVVKALQDPNADVAAAAAEGLLAIGKLAIKPIAKGMKAFNPQARKLAVEKLAAMKDAETADVLVEAMDLSLPAAGGKPDATNEATIKAAGEALVAMGSAAVEPLADAAVRKPGNLELKRQAAGIMKRVGKPYIAAVAKRITAWKTFPDQRELVVWVDVLKAIGGGDATAAEALKVAERQLGGQFVVAPSDTDKLSVYPPGAVAEELFGPGPASPVDFPPVPKAMPANGEVRLALEGGAISSKGPRPIELDIFRHKGQWRPELRGKAYRMHQGTYEGAVLKSSGDDKSVKLSVEVAIMEDPWIKVGGFATYEIEFACKDGAWTGTFSGEFNGKAVKGTVTADVVPWYGQPAAETDVASGEHPRLFFRKRDIGVMRNRARTPLGGAIVKALLAQVAGDVQKIDEAIGWGMLFHLLGEEEYGRQAVAVVQKMLAASSFGSEGGIHDSARNMASVAFAYDLAYNAMTEEERKAANEKFARSAATLGVIGLGNNCLSCNSNWSAVSFGPGGVAAMAVLKEKGPDDLVPPEERRSVVKVEPEATKPSGDGLPVVEPKDGELITDWLMAGPIEAEAGKDVFASVGGIAAAKIANGTEISAGGRQVKFAPIAKAAVRLPEPGIPMDPHILAMGPDAKGRVYLYALLKVAEERAVKVSTAYSMMPTPTYLYVNGRKFVDGDCMILPPGTYRMLAEVTGPMAAPKFLPVNGPLEYGASLRYQWLNRQLAERRAKHARDGEYPLAVDGYKISSHLMNRYFRHAYGDHGWKTELEGYSNFSLFETLTFAAAYRNVTGHHLAYGTGMGWALPMELMRDTPGGGQGYGGGFGLPSSHLWPAMHLAPKELQPAILWEINRRFPPEQLARLSCRDLAWLLANYPFGMEPEHPDKIMPKVMCDRRKGAYLFRRSWGTPEDINTTMFWRSERPNAASYFEPQAASFRINGFGTAFVTEGPGSKHEWQYVVENVVAMEDNNGPGCAKVTHFSYKPDGSGVMAADTSDVYAATKDKNPKGLDVKAERHFAVDYSGASGAPGLWVVADRVKGGGKKSWLAHCDTSCAVATEGNTFTFTSKTGATMKGTVVAPSGAKVSTDMPEVDMEEIIAARKKPKPKPGSPQALKPGGDAGVAMPVDQAKTDLSAGRGVCVTGGDEFLVVLTIQKGTPAPKVESAGAGLGAVVKVGEQEIQLRDGKLVLKK